MAVANVDTVYKGVQDVANKNQIAGYLDSIEFNRYADLAQREWVNEAYMNIGSTQNSLDNLAPFMVSSTPLIIDNQVTLPSDYMHLVSLGIRRYTSQTESVLVGVQILSDSEYRQRSMIPALTPSKVFPVAVIKDGYIQIYPKGGNTVIEMDYVKQPTAPVWGFTVVNDEKVYDSGASTDFLVPEQHTNDLIERIVKMFAMETRDPELYNYDSNNGTPIQ